ncbi:EamA family transporter [Stakelama tenebrarum]|uniref:EamA family transporter n=1 Tax=Stakelama tenebrarum TaxID=2711215 RepID=A0A6G6Y955_9SPHN|nr:EamA family transporter [Sphingosinithalassobacter tenebrarum]QIG81472.1 EamA family transporter [Sphingosinithalassobacter tenebrarum]
MLWIPFTLLASAAQVLRNGAQASLTEKIGTLGATQVRFVFGLPFAILFLLAALALFGEPLPAVPPASLLWGLLGACSQIAATALMLVVMHRRAFGVAYAYIKTEPVLVAVFGVIFLGDHLRPLGWAAVFVVTAGVLIASVSPRDFGKLFHERNMIAAGVTSGALFGLSAIAFRAAIDGIASGGFIVRSLEMLVVTLAIQTSLLGIWLFWRDRAAFAGSLREWRASIGAGFLGALASAGWFCAFALTPAANVRTLGLVEMPIAALLSGRLTGKKTSRHEAAGLGIVGVGILMLLWTAAKAG